jgi:2-polyprenylphenol 6-hydroxylase
MVQESVTAPTSSTALLDVVIVGGGIVGASLALAMRSADVTVGLIDERRPEMQRQGGWDSRVYALSPGNAAWLERLGVWRALAQERLCRVETMRISGDEAQGHLEFDAYEAGLRELAWIIEHGELHRALWRELVLAPYLELYCPAQCIDLVWERDCARLTLADGRVLTARLVVAADGADSWVRERTGVSTYTFDYRETGVVANLATERDHEEVAYQWFRRDGVLAFLPLPGRRISIVWSAPNPHAQALLSAAPVELAHRVESASAGALGRLEVITPARGFPLRRQHVSALVEPRAALVGDAAHNVHPLAGQGMNVGLRDARELAGVLGGREAQRDCGDYALLRRYERARKEDILAVELTTDALQKLFGSRAVSLARLRNLGLALVDAQPQLKNLFVRHAIA